MGKRDFRKDVQGHEGRFEIIHDISEWNGKFGSRIGYTFQTTERNTDIPGTIRIKNTQRQGRDHDLFIDSNFEFVKDNLHTGNIKMDKFYNNRTDPKKTYQIPGKTNFEGIGNRSDPWSYCPDKVRLGHHMLSTCKNAAGIVPFGKQGDRTDYQSIY